MHLLLVISCTDDVARARALIEGQQYESAVTILENRLLSAPKDASAYEALGDAYLMWATDGTSIQAGDDDLALKARRAYGGAVQHGSTPIRLVKAGLAEVAGAQWYLAEDWGQQAWDCCKDPSALLLLRDRTLAAELSSGVPGQATMSLCSESHDESSAVFIRPSAVYEDNSLSTPHRKMDQWDTIARVRTQDGLLSFQDKERQKSTPFQGVVPDSKCGARGKCEVDFTAGWRTIQIFPSGCAECLEEPGCVKCQPVREPRTSVWCNGKRVGRRHCEVTYIVEVVPDSFLNSEDVALVPTEHSSLLPTLTAARDIGLDPVYLETLLDLKITDGMPFPIAAWGATVGSSQIVELSDGVIVTRTYVGHHWVVFRNGVVDLP